MSTHTRLATLRARLDQAITYGTKKNALQVASQGLAQAQAAADAGEREYFLGQRALLKGNFTSAIEHFDAAIQYNPADGGAYNDRALCMVELGIIDAAFAYFDRGISVEPDYATIYHNKGWLLNNLGRHAEAVQYFKQALALEPDRPVTYDNLADALYNLSDYAGALVAYRKVLTLLKPGSCRGIRTPILRRIKEIKLRLPVQKGQRQ